MGSFFVYGLDHCPKCDALKEFLRELGITFIEYDMGASRAYLDSWDALPDDGGAPVLELVDPVRYDMPTFWLHRDLFPGGKLDKTKVGHIVGIEVAEA